MFEKSQEKKVGGGASEDLELILKQNDVSFEGKFLISGCIHLMQLMFNVKCCYVFLEITTIRK